MRSRNKEIYNMMKQNKAKYFIFLFTLVLIVQSCTKEKTYADCGLEFCTTGQYTYANDIAPLIQQSCATNLGPGTGCHDAWIFDYDNVKGIAEDGRLISVILDGSMPQIPNNFGIQPLTQEEIEMFQCWVCDGAKDN